MTAIQGVPYPVAAQMKFYDSWGSAATYPHMAVPWSLAFDTPFQWMKQVASGFGCDLAPAGFVTLTAFRAESRLCVCLAIPRPRLWPQFGSHFLSRIAAEHNRRWQTRVGQNANKTATL
jgi:hypothetical protein